MTDKIHNKLLKIHLMGMIQGSSVLAMLIFVYYNSWLYTVLTLLLVIGFMPQLKQK